jgi:hypothetical protein
MIRVISVHINEPRFIKYQKKLLDKFMSEDFEFIVFDDSQNIYNSIAKNANPQSEDITNGIISICNELGIQRIPVPIEIHDSPGKVHINRSHRIDDPAGWCANSIQFAINYCRDNFKSESDIIVNIDSDMFPITRLDVAEFIGDNSLAGVPQIRTSNGTTINYLWNGIFYFVPVNIEWDLFNWDLRHHKENPQLNCDVGGEMDKYLEKNPIYKKIIHLPSMQWNMSTDNLSDFINIDNKIFEFILNDPRNTGENPFSEIYQPGFLHYRAGGNWDSYGEHDKRKELLFMAIEKLIEE